MFTDYWDTVHYACEKS